MRLLCRSDDDYADPNIYTLVMDRIPAYLQRMPMYRAAMNGPDCLDQCRGPGS